MLPSSHVYFACVWFRVRKGCDRPNPSPVSGAGPILVPCLVVKNRTVPFSCLIPEHKIEDGTSDM